MEEIEQERNQAKEIFEEITEDLSNLIKEISTEMQEIISYKL